MSRTWYRHADKAGALVKIEAITGVALPTVRLRRLSMTEMHSAVGTYQMRSELNQGDSPHLCRTSLAVPLGMNACFYQERDYRVTTSKKRPPPLLSLRSAVVLFAAAIIATLTGLVVYIQTRESSAAAIASGGMFVTATTWLNRNIE